MKLVLRLLDADELRRRGVMEHGQIREQLHRAVRRVLREDGTLERTILDLEEQATVAKQLGIDLFEPGHALAERREDVREPVGMLLLQVLNDVRKVVARLG